MVSRYVAAAAAANGPAKQQEGICLMPQQAPPPPPPAHFRMIAPPQHRNSFIQRPPTPQRSDTFHISAQQQQYGPPQPQSGNQGPGIRAAMAQTGPPTQASTPPNSELKPQPVPQSMNLFVQQQAVRGGAQNAYYQQRGPPQQNQTQRMPNHRQVAQQNVFSAQSPAPYMQVQPPVQPMCYMSYYGSGQRPQLIPQLFSTGQYFPYPPTPQHAPQYMNYSFIQRSQAPPIVSAPQNLQQQPPPQLQQILQNQPQNAQQQNAQQQNQKRTRRPKAISIIDPVTGADKLNEVFDEAESHPPSGESSARQTPQPPYIPNKQEIQAAFTKQVNLLASQDKMDDHIDHSPVPPAAAAPVVVEQQQQHMDPHHPVMTQTVFSNFNTGVVPQHVNAPRNDVMQYSKLTVSHKEFIPGSTPPTAKESTPVVSANADVPELPINTGRPKDRESPAKNRKQHQQQQQQQQREQHSVREKEPVVVQQQQQQQQAPPPPIPQQQQLQQQQQPLEKRPPRDEPKPPMPPPPAKEEPPAKVPETIVVTVGSTGPPPVAFSKETKDVGIVPGTMREEKKGEGRRKEKVEAQLSQQPQQQQQPSLKFSNVPDIVSDLVAAPPVSSMPASDNSKGKQKNVAKQQQQSQQHQQQQQQQLPPASYKQAPAPSVPVPQTQPSKPNNKTNKMKELNMKGANKEGTDMDAFSDPVVAEQAPPQQPPSPPQQQQQQQPAPPPPPPQRRHTPSPPAVVTNNVAIIPVNSNSVAPIENNSVVVPSQQQQQQQQQQAVIVVDSNKIIEESVSPVIKAIEEKVPPPSQHQKGGTKIDVSEIAKEISQKPTPPIPTVDVQNESDKIDLTTEKLVQAKNEANSNKTNASEIDNNTSSMGDIRQQFPYREGQWTPFNTAGEKVYDRDFLMALRNHPKSKEKPDNILESVLQEDRGRIGDISRYPLGGRTTDFAPQFSAANYASKSLRSLGPKRNSQQGKVSSTSKNNKPTVLRMSIRDDVKLHQAENAWKPIRLTGAAEKTEEEKKTENLVRKVRGILNKLTPQKFDSLISQMESLSIDTEDRLSQVMNLVFEKAVDEPNFSVAYASMCQHLASLKVPMKEKSDGDNFVNFRKLLLTRCQKEFEKNSLDESKRVEMLQEIDECTDPEKKKELQLALEDHDRKLRRRSVGNIRFIGELFKKGMLTNAIMIRCLENLLQNKDEENLECLCKLLTTIGGELEKRGVKLEGIFGIVKEIVDRKHCKVSSRVRFMLQDVIDLRHAKWVPRRQDINPKTIDQIQKEAIDEQLNIQVMNSGPHTPRRDDRNSSTADRKQRRNNVSDSEGWTTSQSSRGSRGVFSVQTDKLKNKPPQNDEPLGNSQMFGQWGRGSNLKTNTPSSLAANMYSPLENIGNENEKRNAMSGGYRSRDSYTSKGPSLERNYKHSSYEDGRGSRSGSQHRSQDGSQRGPLLGSSASAQAALSKQPQQQQQQQQQQLSLQQQQQQTQQHQAAPAPTALPPAKAPPEMSRDQLERTMRNILEEYVNDCCTAVACEEDIRDSIPESAYSELVAYGYNNVLERSATARLKTADLFAQLVKMGRLTLDHYCAGLEEIFEQVEDLIIDIPTIWNCLGEIIAPLLYDNTLPLRRLHKSCSILISQGHAAELLAPTFKLVIGEKGPNHLASLWKSSSLNLSEFMPAEKVNDFINTNKLEFLVGGANTSTCLSVLTYEQIHNKLLEFFNAEASFDDITNWVAMNVGEQRVKEKQFIRVLATAILANSVVKAKLIVDSLRKHYNLFNYYVDGNLEYELQVLYAMQAYINKLEVPQGLYLAVFTTLYDDSILSHNSYLNWETSKDAAEQDGKGVALMQLTSFFTHVKEAEDEESSAEEPDP